MIHLQGVAYILYLIEIDEPHGVISIKYRIYSLKMIHRIRNM
jgi:hypothetical protein